ncbi:MAG TPA: type II toxin-antitoxin system VapC family toxin [Candidatus Eremiobacteraeota bacterium]|nr:MAG: tRNA(fMet)-specific endonuclease VapC [bacterium ADurb.Bin363]HPZ09106.1 type II toxin-antitoxin system VapC family toxin [Candidatus Eremiobacteraeota bacterium]
MNGKLLLDTNIIIALFNGEIVIQEKIAEVTDIFISTTVLGELYYGAYRSSQIEENLEKINSFASVIPLLLCDGNTANEYGIIKNLLRKKGTPIPENDIWIASIAKQYNLTLATRDNHFNAIKSPHLFPFYNSLA